MQNENNETREVPEPKIETRFGFEKPRKTQSKLATHSIMTGVVISLGAILWMRAPDSSSENSSGIKTPEASEVNSSSNQFEVEKYSAEADKNQQTEKNKKKVAHVVIKLPGIQKIDRQKQGQIVLGSEIKARLLTGASNGLVKAEALESLKNRGETFVSAGDLLIGQGQSTEERLFIKFTHVVHKDGTAESIQADAADSEDKLMGLASSKFKRYAYKYGAAVGLNFVGGMTEGLQDRTIVGQQVVTTPNAKNALLNGASKAALEMANEQMSEMRNQPPSISVDAGTEIFIIFN